MKTGLIVVLSSMTFAAVIATIYGFATHDVIGILFLGLMALAMVILATYIIVAESEANLAGDRPDMRPSEGAGENIGTYSLESYWPIFGALGAALAALGLVFFPGVAVGFLFAGGALIAWTARFLVREST